MTDQAKGLLITFLGVVFVVPDALFVRLIDAPALTVAFWRLALAGGLAALWLLSTRGTAPFRAVLATGRYGLIYMAGVGCSGVLFILAVSLTSIANVVFIIASLPVFAAIFSRIFLGEPFSPRILLTIAAVVPGLAIIAYGSGETENASLAGDLLALCVSAFFAAGLTAARKVRQTSMVPGVAMAYLVAACCIAPFADPLATSVSQAPLIAMHAGFILLSSVLLAIGPRFITSAEIGLLVLLESVFAPIVAWVVVAESPGIYAVVGGAIILSALAVSNAVVLLRRAKSPPSPPAGSAP